MILAVLQARVSSSRLPGKVLKPILGAPMIVRQIERVRRARRIDRLVLATSVDSSDDALAEAAAKEGLTVSRGSLDDVLDRFVKAAAPFRPDWVVRLTGDCPLADPEVIDHVIASTVAADVDYGSNTLEPTYPDGLDVEVVRYAVLETLARELRTAAEREHVTLSVYRQPDRFRLHSVKQAQDRSALRWTVDESQDFALVERIYQELYPANPAFTTADVLALLARKPELASLNTGLQRNEGLAKSIASEKNKRKRAMSDRYKKSEEFLKRAERTVPLASQTFSKSKTQYPLGVSPYFVQRGKGSRVWDIDGNEYIDFVNGLLSVTLGYGDPDVTSAVRAQLDDGVIFSLPHPLETEVAERIVDMVPCADMVRFGKNGSDATAGAIRLARAFTGRDHVAVCGYHGWQDWYIGATARNRGVPEATRALTHTFAYNELGSLERALGAHPGEFAAVIMEPMNVAEPVPGFLEGVRNLAHRHGALLVFDETITGFRFSNGGAQELFGVTPDLATFGKGIANGYALSAVAGRADVMKLMEEIFFSFTMGGETLSLAAAKATLDKLKREPVTATLATLGGKALKRTADVIRDNNLAEVISVSGHPSWGFLNIRDAGGYSSYEIKTLFLQEVFARGILTLGTHNMSYAHSEADVDRLIAVYREVMPILADAVHNRALKQHLRCEPLQPLFKVR